MNYLSLKCVSAIAMLFTVQLMLASCWAGNSSGDSEETPSVPGSDYSAIDIWCGPHSEALIVDPWGRRIGLDLVTGTSYQEVPDASYYPRYIESSESLSGPEVKELHILGPADGDYRLTVTATRDSVGSPYKSSSASIECYYSDDDARDVTGRDFRSIEMAIGEVHSFIIHFDKTPSGKSFVTGGLVGGDESAEIDQLLSYVNITKAKTELPSGTDSTDLFIIYGDAILAESFKAVLNELDISNLFTPVAGGHEVVRLPVAAGKNVLTLSVLGNVAEEEITDTDFLEFIVK
ncbi:MAG: hypothetical protein AB1483_01535 [Candidatus Zixiibacteriota bacterium]